MLDSSIQKAFLLYRKRKKNRGNWPIHRLQCIHFRAYPSVFVLAEISSTSTRKLCTFLYVFIIMGSKHPQNTFFDFENKMNGAYSSLILSCSEFWGERRNAIAGEDVSKLMDSGCKVWDSAVMYSAFRRDCLKAIPTTRASNKKMLITMRAIFQPSSDVLLSCCKI